MKRWLSKHLYGLGLLLTGRHDIAVLLYFLFLLPGVVLHESSHWLTAKLLRVRTGRISVGPTVKRGGAMRLGAVSVAQTDPLRGSLIGLAPLLTGSAVILLIAYIVFGLAIPGELALNLRLQDIRTILWGYLSIPNFWLWVYLIFSISNAMLPSEADRQAWFSLALYFGVSVAVLYGLGMLQPILPQISDWLLNGLNHLSFAFLVTIAVDAIVILFIFLLERTLMIITGRKVEY